MKPQRCNKQNVKTGLLLRSSSATVEVGMKKSVKGVALNSKVELGTKD